jgi:hypothetical protein
MDAISERGYWLSTSREGHFDDAGLAAALQELFRGKSVIDFGCGTGFYVDAIRSVGTCRGYDGNPCTPELASAACDILDLSRPVDVGAADWVLSLEVAEHIPRQFEDVFIDNLHRHNSEGIVLSWAAVGQGGRGHFNERDEEYVIGRFVDLGYQLDGAVTSELRHAATLEWLRRNVLVFRR